MPTRHASVRSSSMTGVCLLFAFLLHSAAAAALATAQTAVGPRTGMEALVSRADLTYDEPVTRSEEGMPIGNGRMGSLVWTTPRALKFQINRADIFGIDAGSSDSFPRAASDYSNDAAYVDVDFVDFGPEVFSVEAGFSQHLSVYDAVMTARGGGVTARVLAWHEQDVFAIEVDDQRPQPTPVNVDLRSDDGEADYVAQHYAYFLYLMASTSRGDYMPRFGGMLWYTNSDMRAWGSQFWWANQSCYYNGLAEGVGRPVHAADARCFSRERIHEQGPDRVRTDRIAGWRPVPAAQPLAGEDGHAEAQRQQGRTAVGRDHHPSNDPGRDDSTGCRAVVRQLSPGELL